MNPSHFRSMPAPARDPDALEAPAPSLAQDAELGDRLRTVMPWIVSLGAHLGVLLLAAALVTVIVDASPPVPVQVPTVGDEPLDGPNIQLKPGLPGGGVAMPPGGPATLEPEIAGPTLPPPVPGRGLPGIKVEAFTPGIGLQSVRRAANGRGEGIFRMGPVGVGAGPGGERGARRMPKRVVFLVDASGSLVDTLPFVVADLNRLISTDLAKDCAFNVLFFSGDSVNRSLGASQGVTALFGDHLALADPINAAKAGQWMRRVEAGGSGDPLVAIKKAVAMDPEQIQLLSDNITGTGRYEMHQERFMAEVNQVLAAAQRARGHPIQLKTYQFVYPDPLAALGMKPTLLRLVEEAGGHEADYQFITARQLGLR